MRITHLKIERFGHWRELSLALQASDFNAAFGPNEAGKTTLLRFVRGLLYGFDAGDLRDSGGDCGGELELDADGVHWTVRRRGRHLTLVGPRNCEGADAERVLSELLGNIDRDTFESVFCFGLEELQELSVLRGDEIVDQLFGVSLGPEGRVVLDALKSIERRKRAAHLGTDQTASLRQRIDEHTRVARELDQLQRTSTRARELRNSLRELDRSIADMQHERDAARQECRGHQFLIRVHGPWRAERQLRERLDEILEIDDFPVRGIERLDAIERQLRDLAAQRESLRSAWKRLVEERRTRAVDRRFRVRAAAVRLLLAQRDALADMLRETESLREEKSTLDAELAKTTDTPSQAGWTDLESDSPSAPRLLSRAAVNYRTAARRLHRARKAIERRSRKIQITQEELKQAARHWQGQSAAAMLERARREIAVARDRTRLDLETQRLEQLIADLREQAERLAAQEPLPKGVRLTLSGFAFAGLLLAALGLWHSVALSWLAGAVYFLMGVTCGGLSLGLRWHFSETHRERLAELEIAISNADEQRRDVERQRAALGPATAVEDDFVALTERLIGLEQWTRRERDLQIERSRASQWRARVQELRRDFGRRREEWCEALRRCGLTETVKIDDAWDEWERRSAVSGLRRRRREIEHRLDDLATALRLFQRSARELQQEIAGNSQPQSVEQTLADWERQLEELRRERRRRRELGLRLRETRGEWKATAERVTELRRARRALLSAGGASDRETFERRARWVHERGELEDLLEIARAELAAVASTEPDLAIVEDDLLDWDETASRDRLLVLLRNCEQLEGQLEAALDARGQRRHELEALFADPSEPQLRQQLAEIEESLVADGRRWLGLTAAENALAAERDRLERESRPETVLRAERYFQALTGGRYRRLWAPLGQRDLRVEEHTGAVRSLAELSGGTREQLLLALRLALIENFRRRGAPLPFLIDDVLVNFDQNRVASALDTLIEFSREGTQTLLLTCHRHLADDVRHRGLPVQTLPEREPRAERLAG